MTKKIIISLAVIVRAVHWAFYMGKGCFLSIRGRSPPASLSALALEKPPKAAPEVPFADAGAAAMRWAHFKGRYVLLNLWATWCAPCVAELPSLARLQAAVPGLKVLAVNIGPATRWTPRGLPQKPQCRTRWARLSDTEPADAASFRRLRPADHGADRSQGQGGRRAEGPAEWGSPEAVAYFKSLRAANRA